jgi:glycosyltransferase involved in cell wall biosynthesis
MTPVALVTGDFVSTGGMDRANHALARYLAQAGRPVHLVAHRAADDLTRIPGVTFHRVRKPLGSYALGAPFLARAGSTVGRRIAAAGGRVVTNGGNCCFPDVNWVHYVCAVYRADLPNSRLHRLKQQLEYPLNLRAETVALRRARFVVCNSAASRRDVVERVGVPRERTATVYYGSDPTTFRPASADQRAELRTKFGWAVDRPVAIFIGALGDRRKGFDTLFDAWARLCGRSDWNADLAVIGRGAELPAWQARADAQGLGKRIHFLGFRTDVPDLLRAANLLVSPTRYEAYGLGVHEALCCGLPAVVSASAGVAEQYAAGCHELLLPDPDDAADLAQRIETALRDDERLRPQIDVLSARLRSRTWNDMAAEIVGIIEATA